MAAMTRDEYLNRILAVAGKVPRYIEGTVHIKDKGANGKYTDTGETKGSGKMVIFRAEEGAGQFASGVTIGTVVIGGKTYAVRHREVISLHPVETTTAVKDDTNVISL